MTSPFTTAAESASRPANSDILRETRTRLQWLAERQDLRGLAAAVHEIHLRWVRRELDTALYAQLVIYAVEHLDSGQFGDQDQYTLAEHYRLMLLEGAEELPLEIEVKLLFHELVSEYKSIEKSRWPGQRRRQAERLLRGWKRLRDAADPMYDFDRTDFGPQVPLPKGVMRGASGMSPKHIADPKLRAEYEKAIAENSKKAAEHLKQVSIRKLSERFFPRAEAALVERYSRRPTATEELDALLGEYLGDDPARDRIVKKVRSNALNANGR